MIQVCTINILVMISRGRTEKSKNGQKHQRSKEAKDQNQGGQNPQKWENILRLQQQGVRSHDHMIQVWTINILVMPSRGRTEKSKKGQKHHRLIPKGSESRRTKPPKMRKYFKTSTIKVYDPMITWYKYGQSTFSSCHHVAAQRKAKVDKSTIRQKPQRIRIKADKTPKNEKNILRLQQSRCTIPWSHDTGVDNQHSRHAITWLHREKQKWTKAP